MINRGLFVNMKKNFILSCSYKYYRNSIGGTDQYIRAQQLQFNEAGISYYYIFPFNVINSFFQRHRIFWGVVIDGKLSYVKSTDSIISMLNNMQNDGMVCGAVIINHIKNIDLNQLSEIIKALKTQTFFCIHDYYIACISSNFYITECNKVCAHKKIDILLCKDCIYFEKSYIVHEKVLEFFDQCNHNINIICPSELCKSILLKSFKCLSGYINVIPHYSFSRTKISNKECNFPLRVAFIGTQSRIKGWDIFLTLVNSYPNDYKFYYFGRNVSRNKLITNVEVDNSLDKNRMIDRLKEYSIDIVILWSIVPETYSFTYYECLFSNCYIVTSRDSGNICCMVEENNNGLICDENELYKIFSSPSNLEHMVIDYLCKDLKYDYEYHLNNELRDSLNIDLNSNRQITAEIHQDRFKIIERILMILLIIEIEVSSNIKKIYRKLFYLLEFFKMKSS